jgi:hypothetical protein
MYGTRLVPYGRDGFLTVDFHSAFPECTDERPAREIARNSGGQAAASAESAGTRSRGPDPREDAGSTG